MLDSGAFSKMPGGPFASSVLGAPLSGAGYVGGDSTGAVLKTVEVRDGMNLGDPAHPHRFLRLRIRR